jgi:anti-sigma factor RsiW
MDKILKESNLHEYLTAFADGELDAGQILAVLNRLSNHPEALEMMRGQQQLRLEAHRVVLDNTPPVPIDLRQRIQAMAEQTDKSIGISPNRGNTPPSSKNSPPRPRNQLWAVAAVSFLLGIVVGNLLARHPSPHQK